MDRERAWTEAHTGIEGRLPLVQRNGVMQRLSRVIGG